MSTFRQVPMAHRSQAGSTPSSPKASPFTPATLTPTLPLQIAERIGEAIVDEQFAPGERLKEVDLATAFGVSRTTVREALRILESRGLVQILPQRGAQVTQLSRIELENLFEIRAVLLGLAARHAARNGNAADQALLQARITALAAARDDAKAYARASAEIVDCVARLSKNDQLADMIAGFAQRIGRYTRLGLASRERRAHSLANWRRLVQAVATRNQQTAEDINRRLALENRDAALIEIERRTPAAKTPRARSG
jgi:DNA-binding GntR family transcriptional regulator